MTCPQRVLARRLTSPVLRLSLLRSYPTARPSGYVSNVEYLMLCSHQQVFAHSLFPSLYLNLSYLFLETYIPRSPTLYNGADTIYRGQSCLSCEGAVGSLASLKRMGIMAIELSDHSLHRDHDSLITCVWARTFRNQDHAITSGTLYSVPFRRGGRMKNHHDLQSIPP